jgi:diguanylate cyclase (GGDEF)-like protein
MGKIKFRIRSILIHIRLILISIFISITICFVLYMFASINTYPDSTKTPGAFIILIIAVGVLLAAVFILSGIIISKFRNRLVYINELHAFRDYFNSLYGVSSEEEVYKVLYDFLSDNPNVSETAIFYTTDTSEESPHWKTISKKDYAFCNMSAENCPVLDSGREYYVKTLKNIQDCCPHQLSEYKTGSCICFPVVDINQVQSILQLYSNKEYGFDGVTIFKIKSYIEIAKSTVTIKRAINTLGRNAITDKLTNLHNRNFLDAYLENQIEAANLTNQEISVIMVDIDHFKTLNDTYGHVVGDHILTFFAQLLKRCIRKTDRIVRYGGDEFLVILPSTDIETAKIIAERIRYDVYNINIPSFRDITIPQISCSLGVSTYPGYCDNKDDLIRTSDLALYKAKKSGRNCMKVYKKKESFNF